MHMVVFLSFPSLLLPKLRFWLFSACALLRLAEHAWGVRFVFVSPFAGFPELTRLERAFTDPPFDTALVIGVGSLGAYCFGAISGDRFFLRPRVH